jgi:branched-subunit amino acid aminotransferase/4-amino-4-deoxychorismate lyase
MLPGIWRESFIKEVGATEHAVSPADLARAEAIVIGNSVRGAMSVGEVFDKDSGQVLWKEAE